MLEQSEIDRIQSTFAAVGKDPTGFGTAFYERLFRMAPAARPLFRDDISVQADKLADMMTTLVNGLDDLPGLVPILKELGERHSEYGAVNEHYALVGKALVDTLASHVPGWSDIDSATWQKLYLIVATTMMSGVKTPVELPRTA